MARFHVVLSHDCRLPIVCAPPHVDVSVGFTSRHNLHHTEINLSLNLKRCKGKLTIKQVSNRVFLAGNWCVPVVVAGRPNRKLRFVNNVSCVLSITSYFNIKLVSFIHIDWQVPFRVISFSHLFVLSWKWLLYQKQVRWAFFPFQTRDVFFVSS